MIEELCLKDKLLEDQRKIIFEIQIKLDEKQKELEELRQLLDTRSSSPWTGLRRTSSSCSSGSSRSTRSWKSGADAGFAQPRAGGARGGRRPNRQHDETEHVWRELDETRRQVEQLSRVKVALEVGLTLARLDELAVFLVALLSRLHLLASLLATNRSSLLQLLDQSRSLYASALAVSAALEDSLIDYIHKVPTRRNTPYSYTSFWMMRRAVLLCSRECRLRGQRSPGDDRWPRPHFG
ncbi:Hypothetical predicted protein [Cloeon dipterum]|uniref:Uncharacterized protein n=1 Tax=Cloeon dipterum TaxID=197152 RepID=A0A8S1E6Z0_9INSE|nr:Hypothetical predicted protein [Cloeon dipterum]